MKISVEFLPFPSVVKDKIKTKASLKNLSIKYINGHKIIINKTNLSIIEPHKIIISNSYNTLIAYIYEDSNKIYLPNNVIITLSKLIEIINTLNNQNQK